MMTEKACLFQDRRVKEFNFLRQTRARTSALVEACVTSTTRFETALAKTPFLLATLPSSHRTRP